MRNAAAPKFSIPPSIDPFTPTSKFAMLSSLKRVCLKLVGPPAVMLSTFQPPLRKPLL